MEEPKETRPSKTTGQSSYEHSKTKAGPTPDCTNLQRLYCSFQFSNFIESFSMLKSESLVLVRSHRFCFFFWSLFSDFEMKGDFLFVCYIFYLHFRKLYSSKDRQKGRQQICMGGCVGRIWKKYREGNHNQDIICDKKINFQQKEKK